MDLRDIVKAAREQGFRVDRTSKGHWVFYHPDPKVAPIYFSGTPGDWRAIHNLLGKLRRAGFIWPWSAQRRKE